MHRVSRIILALCMIQGLSKDLGMMNKFACFLSSADFKKNKLVKICFINTISVNVGPYTSESIPFSEIISRREH